MPNDTKEWTPVEQRLPEEGIAVETKIHDDRGIRNEQRMWRRGRLWFVSGEIYAYYTPTHWRPEHAH